jgi:hypothetical protein
MITHLISTTEFVKLINSEKFIEKYDNDIENTLKLIKNYVTFISQKPTKENCKLYFKNCEHTSFDKIKDINRLNELTIYHYGHKLKLTETALKQIGLLL